jgi:hypothetical protein
VGLVTTAAVVALSLLGLVMAGAIVLATRVVSFAGPIRHPRAVLQVLWLAALFTLLPWLQPQSCSGW